MQSLVDFLSGYEPEYRSVVRGYSAAELEEFESVVGRPLPSFFRDFLVTAAANLGYLHHGISFDVAELTDFIELKRATLEQLGWVALLVGVDETETHSDYYIRLDRPAPHCPGDGELVRSASGGRDFDDEKTGYECLHDLLFVEGFRNVRMLRLRERMFSTWRCESREQALELLATLGHAFQHLEFTSPVRTGASTPLYDRSDCAAIGSLDPIDHSISFYLAGSERKIVSRVGHTLLDQVSVEGQLVDIHP